MLAWKDMIVKATAAEDGTGLPALREQLARSSTDADTLDAVLETEGLGACLIAYSSQQVALCVCVCKCALCCAI